MKDWIKNAVIYQIYPRSFCDSNGDGIGDINGICSKLEYIKELGATCIWLSPVYKSPNDDNGYDISDYRDIMTEFGTLGDFKVMLATAHSLGLRVIMDLVINHTSDEHEWFKLARTDPKYRDYYIIKKGRGKKPPNNWSSFFTGPAWERFDGGDDYYLHLFSKKQPDLNMDNPAVREEIKGILRFWLDLGVDGFRCDVINLISKAPGLPQGKRSIALRGREHYVNGPRLFEYLKEFRAVLDEYDTLTVGECVLLTAQDALNFVAGENPPLDMVFSFEHMSVDNIFKWLYVNPNFKRSKLKKALSDWQHRLIEGGGWNSLYFENHDQPRSVSRFGNESLRTESAKMLATLLFFMQGTPFIYQGQELGMTNPGFDKLSDYRDVETFRADGLMKRMGFTKKMRMKRIKYMSRDNARTPIQWDDSVNAGFTNGEPWIAVNANYKKVNAKRAIQSPDSVLNYYKRLIALRAMLPVAVYGDYTEHYPRSNRFMIYERKYGGATLLVICNLTAKDVDLVIPKGLDISEGRVILCNYPNISAVLQPYEARVYYLGGKPLNE